MLAVEYSNNPDTHTLSSLQYTVSYINCKCFCGVWVFSFPACSSQSVSISKSRAGRVCVCVWGQLREHRWGNVRRKTSRRSFAAVSGIFVFPQDAVEEQKPHTLLKITLINPHPAQTHPSTTANHCLPLAVIMETQQDIPCVSGFSPGTPQKHFKNSNNKFKRKKVVNVYNITICIIVKLKILIIINN